MGDELVVTGTDASGIALVSVTSDLRATDYAAIAWIAADVPERADVRMLWRSDYQPNKLNSAAGRRRGARAAAVDCLRRIQLGSAG